MTRVYKESDLVETVVRHCKCGEWQWNIWVDTCPELAERVRKIEKCSLYGHEFKI